MPTVASIFKVSTHRPLKEMNKVSISELAQFTEIYTDSIYDTDDTIRQEWKNEIISESDMDYLQSNRMRVSFVDGSYLTVYED